MLFLRDERIENDNKLISMNEILKPTESDHHIQIYTEKLTKDGSFFAPLPPVGASKVSLSFPEVIGPT